MLNPSQTQKIRSAAKALLLIAFFAVLWLPIIASVLHWETTPTLNEKRALAPFPTMNSKAGVQSYLAGLDAYHNDHFGFRNQLIRWERLWKRKLFREYSFPGVLVGREEWLFYSAEQMLENYHGTSLFDQKQLETWQSLLEHRRDWLAQRGIRYLFVVPPDKHTIYPEFLPSSVGKPGATTKLEQFIAHMKAHSTVEVLDLRPVLLRGKATGQTYFRTDAHWNQYGAFIAYQELIRTLARQMPALEPLPRNAFMEQTRPQPGGDLAALIGQEQTMSENASPIFTLLPPRQPLKQTLNLDLLGKKWETGKEPVITKNPDCSSKAIIFRDSFSIAWIPFIGHHFSQVTYVWQQNWDLAFIEQEKPDLVIDEILERFFCTQDPQQLKSAEGWK